MKATSPYLNLPVRPLSEVRGETVRHMPEPVPAFLLGADEVCISVATRKNRWCKKSIIWAVVLACLVLGATVGPRAILYLQAALGE